MSNTEPLTISIELNREAILHLLKYIRGIYLTEHMEGDSRYEIQEYPYCLTMLVSLSKAKDDILLQEKIQELRMHAKMKKNKVGEYLKKKMTELRENPN